MNFINASSSLKDSESWTPLCLPKFNDQGYLHAYVCFIAPEVCLLLISTKPDSFYQLSECKNLIARELNKIGAIDATRKALQSRGYSVCKSTERKK